ncbi:hypothetical protein CLG96_03165 [Sphingomonas oleivorans]|uniref:Uncharacterized protein n=1 Tax=Sphingomonas oleivorans TaxID=1735121 RepID=A0A2T5G1X7_9SPHN|nr:hypothetical protein [Sphingomonas oleivorans]PTQ13145.1 hypothetical protein CLG96_03165 [Sphingomonas oleivorans]
MRLAPILIALIPAILLLSLSLPSFIAACTALSADTTLAQIQERQSPSRDALLDAARANQRAAAFFESARYRTNAAIALFELTSSQRRSAGDVADVERLLRDALAAAPASPYNWARLAALRLAANDKRGAQQAWQMSVLTGRYVPGLMNARLELGFRMFPIVDPELAELLADQVRLSMRNSRSGVAKVARANAAEPFIRAALWSEPELSRNFESAYAKLVAKRKAGL